MKRVYGELTGNPNHGLEPKELCDIADGKREGDAEAARKAFAEMGEIAGDAMATTITLIDGLIVIGGGITGARKWIMPSLLKELRGKMHTITGEELNRVQMKVYDLDNEDEFKEFAKGDPACAEGLRHGSLRGIRPPETHRSHDLETRGEQCHLGGRLCICPGPARRTETTIIIQYRSYEKDRIICPHRPVTHSGGGAHTSISQTTAKPIRSSDHVLAGSGILCPGNNQLSANC